MMFLTPELRGLKFRLFASCEHPTEQLAAKPFQGTLPLEHLNTARGGRFGHPLRDCYCTNTDQCPCDAAESQPNKI